MLLKKNKFEIKSALNNYFNNYYDRNELREYLKNKKIAIIGPSPSVKDEENGDYIENNYDIIVRLNKQWKHDESLNKYIGKRTDILFNCLNYSKDCGGDIDINYLNKMGVKYIISTTKYEYNSNDKDKQFSNLEIFNYYYYFHQKNKNLIKFIPIENHIYDKFSKLCNTRLNTGLAAIFYLLEFDIKELYIKGFSFFTDGYLLDYRNEINNKKVFTSKQMKAELYNFLFVENSNHNVQNQFDKFKEIYSEKKNIIKLDKKLKYLININKLVISDE